MKDKKILVVGGTGSWGEGLIRELLKQDVKQIKVFARNESQMIKLVNRFQTAKIEPIIGDIRDRGALLKACQGSDLLFHLAALKHVPICEQMPIEAIETNVHGTQNVIDCALEAQLEKVIYVSTDKVVNANCTYGCTKRLGEKLILAAAKQSSFTKFIVFRGGNLLGSSGSVIPLFKKQIQKNRAITLTDERMNRFFISIERASKLLVEIAGKGAGGELFLPAMPSLLIKDIAAYLLKQNGLKEDAITVAGIRPGEKINEELITEHERKHIYRFNEDLYLVSARDPHAWIANGIMKQEEDYIHKSECALFTYEQTEQFLQEANI